MKENKNILKIMVDGKIPEYKTEDSSGIDIYTSNSEEIIINPNESKMIPTGLRVEIPRGFFGAIYPRSSTGVKLNLALLNTVGIIDSDYRGEIKLFMYNFGKKPVTITCGQRLVQLVIQPYNRMNIEVADKLSDTERGEGGFGSTGNK